MRVVLTRTFHHTGPGRGEAFAESSFARQIAEIEARAAAARARGRQPRGGARLRRRARRGARLLAAAREGRGRGRPTTCAAARGRPHRDLLDMLLAASSARVEVRVDPERLRPADVPAQVGDPSRLRAATGWEPRIPLEQHAAGPARRLAGPRRARRRAARHEGPAHRRDRLPRPHRGAPPRGARATPCACSRAATSRPRGPAGGRRGGRRGRHRRRLVRARGRGLRRRAPHGRAREDLGAGPRALRGGERRRARERARGGPGAAGARLVYTSSFMALGPSGAGALDAARLHPGPPLPQPLRAHQGLADAAGARGRGAAARTSSSSTRASSTAPAT